MDDVFDVEKVNPKNNNPLTIDEVESVDEEDDIDLFDVPLQAESFAIGSQFHTTPIQTFQSKY